MKAYKFFRPGRVAPFSQLVWPLEGWVEAGGPLHTCRSGVHACRPEQLAYWLAEELWEVELEGELVESELKVVASRGRLLRPVAAWDEEAQRELAAECVRRTAAYAAAELRELGQAAEADGLEQAAGVDELVERAEAAGEAAARLDAGDAVDLAGYVGDAATYAEVGHAAGAAFVAAHAANVHAPAGIDDPFGAERAGQARWLAARVGISAGSG